MADIPAKAEIGVTTGPIRGSKKIHVGPLDVAMREIHLDPSSGEPPLRVYDTSGPYTDPSARIDIMAGLPQRRRAWIEGRGDPPQGTVFVPFFDEGRLINDLTLDAHDPFSKQPDFKKCAARVSRIAEPAGA